MRSAVALLGPLLALQAFAQPAFDVASLRLTEPGARGFEGFQIRTSPDSLTTRGISLKECIIWAYGIPGPRIIGPDWLDSTRLDILGKAPTPSSREQLYLMLQRLLAERLNLKTHTERREMPVLVMTTAKGVPKFSESATDGPLSYSQDNGALLMQHVSIFDLIAKLSGRVFAQTIVDETGLKGRYDIRLDMAAVTPANPDDRMDAASAMIVALRDQMGLKLDARKQEVDVLVIDRVDKIPAEN